MLITMRLNTLIQRVEKAQGEVLGFVRKACEGEEKMIVNLNKLQLHRGENAEGELMNGGIYSEHYAAFRRRKGLPTDRVYLLLSGDLQDGMRVEYSDTGFAVVSSDEKQWMVDYTMETGNWPSGNKPHYGPVFGLDEVSRGLLTQRILPTVARSLRRRLVG